MSFNLNGIIQSMCKYLGLHIENTAKSRYIRKGITWATVNKLGKYRKIKFQKAIKLILSVLLCKAYYTMVLSSGHLQIHYLKNGRKLHQTFSNCY